MSVLDADFSFAQLCLSSFTWWSDRRTADKDESVSWGQLDQRGLEPWRQALRYRRTERAVLPVCKFRTGVKRFDCQDLPGYLLVMICWLWLGRILMETCWSRGKACVCSACGVWPTAGLFSPLIRTRGSVDTVSRT